MPDIMMIFKYLHNQFGCFNRNIQTARFAKFIGFKNRLTLPRTDVAAQKIRKNRFGSVQAGFEQFPAAFNNSRHSLLLTRTIRD